VFLVFGRCGLTNRWSGRVWGVKCQAQTSARAPLSSTVRQHAMSAATSRPLFALVMLLWIAPALAGADDVCGEHTSRSGTVFTLSVDRSFEPSVSFKLCNREDKSKRFLLVSAQSRGHKDGWDSKSIPLGPEAYERLARLHEQSLNYDVRIGMGGNDGSLWCLETQRGFTYSKACFWTPTEEASARRLNGLIELGKALWELAKLDSSQLH
jgi:hypothetical protein